MEPQKDRAISHAARQCDPSIVVVVVMMMLVIFSGNKEDGREESAWEAAAACRTSVYTLRKVR